jgi:hypothetical protein
MGECAMAFIQIIDLQEPPTFLDLDVVDDWT